MGGRRATKETLPAVARTRSRGSHGAPPASALAALVFAIWAAFAPASAQVVDLQGHRGARGLAPENTLTAFARALAIGVTTLELDLGVTADGVPVASHDRRLSPVLTRDRSGRWIAEPGPLIRTLRRAELAAYEVGRIDPSSRYADRFPAQQAVDGERIPTLGEVIALTAGAGADRVRLNVEIKIHPEHPEETLGPEAFAAAVLGELRARGALERATIQSFDWRALASARRIEPGVRTAYLTASQRWLDNLRRGSPGPSPWTAGIDVDDHGGSAPRAVAAAGGDVWSPYYRELDAASLAEARRLGLEVVVWTVNDGADMVHMLELGVDGIITDYPDRLRAVLEARGMLVPRPFVARSR
jgi:glycerophosphoryl diester phosphodiesterase